MRIQYFLNPKLQNLINKQLIEKKIYSAMKLLDINMDNMDVIIISDDDNYSNAISIIDNNERYVEGKFFKSLGKSNLSLINNIPQCSIVYNICVFNPQISINENALNDYNQKQLIIKMCGYALYHELGHCKDYLLRRNDRFVASLDQSKLLEVFKIDNMSKYYINILLTEFVACINSAFAFDEKLMYAEKENFLNTINEYIINIENRKLNYIYDNSELRNIAFTVTEFFWFILSKFSDLVAFKLGNQKLSSYNLLEGLSNYSQIEYVLKNFYEFITNLWKDYPNFNKDFVDTLTYFWYQLAFIHGYEFQFDKKEDIITWNE